MNNESERVKYLLQNWSHLQLAREYEKLENIIKEVREYIEEEKLWYDKELGLVQIKGYGTDRIPIIYIYGLLDILDKGEQNGK